VDLSVAWEGYKAAKLALNNTIVPTNVTYLQSKYWSKVAVSNKEISLLPSLSSFSQFVVFDVLEIVNFLVEGVLVEEFILDNINKLLSCLREANSTLRWLLLRIFAFLFAVCKPFTHLLIAFVLTCYSIEIVL
jgi:WASH complex subunit strumpellin